VARRPFEQIVRDHGPAVLRVCRALAPPAAAEDAWSETFLAALRAYPGLAEDANVEAWLVTIARHKCIDQHRAAGRRAQPRALDGADTDPATPRSRTDLPGERPDDELRAAVQSLPPTQRDAVVLHHLGGLPYALVAEVLGNSEAAARRAAADGMRRLRTIYGSTP
jgi:RNA polymerase sigma factor (sigma-70 family)